MKHRILFCLLFVPACLTWSQNQAPGRPPITGVSHISVYASDPSAAQHFYRDIVGCVPGADPENPAGARYYVNATQFIEVLPLPPGAGVNRLDHFSYITGNAGELRRYLAAHGVKVPARVEQAKDGERWFRVKDPEGNTVEFTEPPAHLQTIAAPLLAGHRIIHVGMLVHSREAEDPFYRVILGFRPYWFGGMQADKIDWVSQQTPDGHDWLEYMLTSGPSGSGIPAKMSQHQLGVLNHFSIGVVDMQKTYATLKAGGRLVPAGTKTQIGRDGKWQLNIYDPDETRVEYMEYGNVQEPCCSPFTATNPSPAE